jgi:hypothetical protein
MRFKPTNCKRLQGVADARRRARRRTFVLQVPDNKADAVPCERLRKSSSKPGPSEIFTQSLHYLYATFKKMSYYLNTKSLICGAGHRK